MNDRWLVDFLSKKIVEHHNHLLREERARFARLHREMAQTQQRIGQLQNELEFLVEVVDSFKRR